MKKWVMIALAVQAVLIAGLAGVMYFVPVQLRWESGPSRSAPAPAKKDTVRPAPVRVVDWQEFDQRWADAPEDIRALARQIAEGEVPDLTPFSAGQLGRGYRAPTLDFSRNGTPVAFEATLLIEAAKARNLPATRALLDAGADPGAWFAEVLFIMTRQRTRDAPAFLLFPDFDETLPYLRAYLEAGADPNVLRHGFLAETPFTRADLEHNLGAMVMMLDHGADPWLRLPFPDTHQSGGYLGYSVMLEHAGGSSSASIETFFRMARSGALPKGTQEDVQEVLDRLAEVIESIGKGPEPEIRHLAWRLDQLYVHLGIAWGLEDEFEALRDRLPDFDYQADGGWYLAEDELHSRHDAPLSVPDKGSETWGP